MTLTLTLKVDPDPWQALRTNAHMETGRDSILANTATQIEDR